MVVRIAVYRPAWGHFLGARQSANVDAAYTRLIPDRRLWFVLQDVETIPFAAEPAGGG